MDKRKDPRFRTRFDALYSLGCEEGSGVLADLSYSGARLDNTSLKPEPGTKVTAAKARRKVAPAADSTPEENQNCCQPERRRQSPLTAP